MMCIGVQQKGAGPQMIPKNSLLTQFTNLWLPVPREKKSKVMWVLHADRTKLLMVHWMPSPS
jgi:hypothetical protein